MTTYAVVIAGGSGSRMGQSIPKQFLTISNKPVLIYTLENFQHHPEIDKIIVVCIKGWEEVARAYCRQFGITKLAGIAPGGASGQESIRNGVFSLEDMASDDDLVVIHDGVRPLVDAAVLSDVIRVAHLHGNAVSSMPYNEQIFLIDQNDPSSTTKFIPRDKLRRVVTPQAYQFRLLDDAYHRAFAEHIGIGASDYTNTMMAQLGIRLHFAAGSDKNIKLTTKDNLEMFKAYLAQETDTWLK